MSDVVCNTPCLNDLSPLDKIKASKILNQITLLQNLLIYITNGIHTFNKISIDDKINAIRIISELLDALKSLEKPTSFKSQCSRMHNELLSIREGIEDNLVEAEDLKLYSFITTQELVSKKLTLNKNKLNKLCPEEENNSSLPFEAETTVKNLIDKSKECNITIGRASVIPFGDFDKSLAEKYFDSENFYGYSIFKNQLLVGIKQNEERISIDEVLDTLNEEGSIKYTLISNKSYFSKETGFNVFWYWVASKSDAKKLAQLFNRPINSLSFVNWGISI